MSCIYTLNGIVQDCKNNTGGISAVIVANRSDVTMSQTTGGGYTFVPKTQWTGSSHYLAFIPGSNSTLTSTATVDKANGTNYVETVLQLQFNKQSTDSARALNKMISGDDLVFIVRDNNGELFIVGYSDGCYMSEGTSQTGTARTDGNYYQISFKCVEDDYPPLLDQSATENSTILQIVKNYRTFIWV